MGFELNCVCEIGSFPARPVRRARNDGFIDLDVKKLKLNLKLF